MAPTSDILRTNNPASYTLVDGVVIDSRTPPSSILGIGNDIVCVIGEFQKGPVNAITDVGSAEEFGRIFGGFGPDAAVVYLDLPLAGFHPDSGSGGLSSSGGVNCFFGHFSFLYRVRASGCWA